MRESGAGSQTELGDLHGELAELHLLKDELQEENSRIMGLLEASDTARVEVEFQNAGIEKEKECC